MRLFFFVLFILLFGMGLYAQPSGYKWAPGKLYHTSGEVFTGEVAWAPTQLGQEDGVYFRRSNDLEPIPVTADRLLSFTMDADSFVVSRNQDMQNAILLVDVDGPVKVYARQTKRKGLPMMVNTGGMAGAVGVGIGLGGLVGGGTRRVYYYGNDANNITKLNKKQFTEVMSNAMADRPEVVAKIKDKTYKYGDMKELLEFYRTGQQAK